MSQSLTNTMITTLADTWYVEWSEGEFIATNQNDNMVIVASTNQTIHSLIPGSIFMSAVQFHDTYLHWVMNRLEGGSGTGWNWVEPIDAIN